MGRVASCSNSFRIPPRPRRHAADQQRDAKRRVSQVFGKGTPSTAQEALAVEALWKLWIGVEKTYDRPFTLPRHLPGSVHLQLDRGTFPGTGSGFVVVQGTMEPSLTRGPVRLVRAAEDSSGACAITRIIGKSGEKSYVVQDCAG